tara:strand:+ start:32 stop:529 length:498 start_codon:yes stop_codon:yes gene_type:complete
MIQIYDDIITGEESTKIKELLLGNEFSWYYLSDITGHEDGRPGFSHYFVTKDGKVNSPYSEIISNIIFNSCRKINHELKEVTMSRAFLQLPIRYTGDRIDTHHIDKEEPHTVVLYYVNDSDGDTVIGEQRVTPKQGRVVIFDGSIYHAGSQPHQSPRCIINSHIA